MIERTTVLLPNHTEGRINIHMNKWDKSRITAHKINGQNQFT